MSLKGLTTFLMVFTFGCAESQFIGGNKSKPVVKAKPGLDANGAVSEVAETEVAGEKSAVIPDKFTCSVTSSWNFYKNGSAIPLQVESNFREDVTVSLNQSPIGKQSPSFKINGSPSADGNFKFVLESKGKQALCELKVAVVADNTKNLEELSLCYGQKGAGKKTLIIAVIQTDDWFDHYYNYILADAVELNKMTGIQFDVFRSKDLSADIAGKIESNFYDSIWYLSGKGTLSEQTLGILETAYKKGVGFFVLADNEPWSTEANQLLTRFNTNQTFIGPTNLFGMNEYTGEGVLSRRGFSTQSGLGEVYNHPVNSGLFQNISEGSTIAVLNEMNDPRFEPVLRANMGKILAASFTEKQGTISKRLLMHGAFTSLYRMGSNAKYGWDSASAPGTKQFFANAACWLAKASP